MPNRWGFARKTFLLFLAILLSMSGMLPNLVGLSKAFAFGTNGPNEYLIIKESTTWSEDQTIEKPVIIAPNVTLTISDSAVITFNQDLIIYGKFENYGTVNYSTNLYANIYGGFSGDLNYPDYGVVSNYGHINGGNMYFDADAYPVPPFISSHSPGTGTDFITGETVPGFVVNIGGFEQTASLDGNYNIEVGEIIGSQTLQVKVTNIFGREFILDPIQIEDPGSTDMTAPTWAEDAVLTSSNLTENGVTLSWNHASDESGISDYYIHQNGNRIGLVSGDTTSYEVTGLTPGTSYQFNIVASDAYGNVSTSGPSIEITTPATPSENQAPNWPIDAKLGASNIGDSSLNLSWPAATDDVGVNNYNIYKNGSLLVTVGSSALSYTVTGLSPSTPYTFKVEAGDSNGNWSSEGPSLEVTTVAPVPTAKVTFPDSRVEEAVRSSLGKPVGDITKEEMLGLKSLYLYSGVKNLAGLQYALNLEYLYIEYGSSLMDFTVIGNLTNLTQLTVYNSELENLDFLSGLTKLRNLNLQYNRITDLSPVSKLVNLTTLNVSNNKIKDLTGIETLTKLIELYLYENQIEDISPIVTIMENGALGLDSMNSVNVESNYLELTQTSPNWKNIQILKENGVNISYYQQYGKITVKATDLYKPDKEISGLYAYLSGAYNYETEVDGNGTYTFSHITPGNYTIYVSSMAGNIGEEYESISREIKVLSGQKINLNIGLTPIQLDPSVSSGVITGTVKDENGVPVKGAKVFVQNGTETTYTDDSGSYILQLAEGTYSIMAEANGYESDLAENLQISVGQKSTNEFQLISTAGIPKVTFPDSRVEEAVRSSLGKPVGDITKEEMLGLKNLYLYSGVKNLAGLQYALNLEYLYIEYGSSSMDFTVIGNLTNLTQLTIYNSGLENLDFLSGLTKLRNLNLQYNRITDLSPVSNLVNLTTLNVSNNKIKNLTGIETLTKLIELYLYENQIEDISPIVTIMENGALGLDSMNSVNVESNYLELTQTSPNWKNIQILKENGVNISYYQQYGKITVKATDLYKPDKEISGLYAYLSGGNNYETEVDGNGTYTFSHITPGNYTIYVSSMAGDIGEEYESISREIKVLSGQKINLNIDLTPTQHDPSITNGVITGIVKDENGVPVQGAKVYVDNGAEPVYTDFVGYYALAIEEGSYTVMYEAPVNLSAKKENVIVTKGNKTLIDILLAFTSDTIAPEWVADPKLEVSNLGESQVTLSWSTASDNVKIENYKVYQNGTLQKIVPGTTTSVEMTGLTTGTDYTFKVEAGDGSGNWTSNGPETTIRTHAQADLAINFVNEKVYVNQNSSLTLKASHASNLYGFDIEIKYDPNLIEVTDIKLNESFGVNGTSASLFHTNQEGVIRLVGTKVGNTKGLSGEANLVDISYKTLDKEGTAGFTILKGSSVSDTSDTLYVSNQDVTAELAITIPVEGVTLDHTSMTLDTSTNSEGVLVATVFPDTATNKEVTWSTSDPSIIEVDQTGKLTAKSAGTATITAVTTDKQFKAESIITVISSVTGIELDKKNITLDAATKESTVVTAKVLPENATNKKVIWNSSNTSVATVDDTGKVQAVGLGNAVITATTEEGAYSAAVNVKVTGIANFTVATSKDIIEKGETVTVDLKVTDSNHLNQFLLGFNYNQELFELVNITLNQAFGTVGTSADLSYTDDNGKVAISGKLKDSQAFRDGTLGLVKVTLKAKTKTQSSYLSVSSKSEYVDTNNITYLLQNNVEKSIAITQADVTNDNTVAINDLGKVARAFGKKTGEIGYLDSLDMNKDGVVDIIDIAYVANKVLNKPISTFALRSYALFSVNTLATYNMVEKTTIELGVDQDPNELVVGEVVNIKINAVNPKGLFGTQFTFKYDPAKMQLVDDQVHFNENFSSFGGCSVDTVNGVVKCPVINSGSTTFSGDLVEIGYIPVKLINPGKTTLSLSEIKAVDNQIKEINNNEGHSLDLTVNLDETPPVAPSVSKLTDQDTTVTGTTEANAEVTLMVGESVIGSGSADEAGKFSINIDKQKAGTTIAVIAKDKAENASTTDIVVEAGYTPIKIQLNGKDFALGGYYRINTTYVNWNALKTLNIPYTDKGNGVFIIEGRNVQGVEINGDWYIEWKQLSPGKITFEKIEGGYNFIYTKPIKIQLNGKDFTQGGYYRINTTYVNWNALKTLQIPYTFKGNGVFLIEDRTVKAEYINGDWYIEWKQLSPGKITFEKIEGGYNFIYTKPIKIQLNGKDFTLGAYYRINTTYVNWNALKSLEIPYTYKGNGVFLIEGRTIKGESINGDWYIEWKQLSPGKITFQNIEGGYNFIYTKPIKIQFNGKDFTLGGYYRINTTYVNWNALKTLKIPYSYKGNGVFLIEGRSVKGASINGDWYIEWKQLSPGKVTFQKIEGGYNFIYKP